MLYTEATLTELVDVLNRTWLKAKLVDAPDCISDLLEAANVLGEPVTGYVGAAGAVADPFDEMFSACAVLGAADYVVTRDGELLALEMYRGIEFVRPGGFLQILTA